MKKLYYFHGWNSAIPRPLRSVEKMRILMDWCKKNDYVFCPTDIDYQVPQYYVDRLAEEISDPEVTDVILTGTSLGGWFARILSLNVPLCQDKITTVALNPAISPGESLRKYAGQMHTNYVTGKEVPWNFLDCDELELAQFKVLYWDHNVPFYVFCDKGDEVISWEESKHYHESFASFYAFEGGNHQFEHFLEVLEFLRAKKTLSA